jgi:hypothetical protein
MVLFTAVPIVSGLCPREPVTVGISPSFPVVLPSLYLEVTTVPQCAATMVECVLATTSTFMLGVALLRATRSRCTAFFVVAAHPLLLLLVILFVPRIADHICLHDSGSRYYYYTLMYYCFFLRVVTCICSCSSRCYSTVCHSTYIFVTSVRVGGSRQI